MPLRNADVMLISRSGVKYRVTAEDVGTFVHANNTYLHEQPSAELQWTINHNFGARPVSVTLLSAGGVEVDADVTHVSVDQITVTFKQPFAGCALVS